MRVSTTTGAFVYLAGCGAKGGDVLAYEMLASDGALWALPRHWVRSATMAVGRIGYVATTDPAPLFFRLAAMDLHTLAAHQFKQSEPLLEPWLRCRTCPPSKAKRWPTA